MRKRVRRATNGDAREGECCSEDRISHLPDELLVSILSLLPLKQAAATSVLSRQWRYLWTFSSSLNFDANDVLQILRDADRELRAGPFFYSKRRKYVRWVNRVLAFHKSLNIEEFKVCFCLSKSSKASIDRWLKFALSRKVRSLELNFTTRGGPWHSDPYEFPCELLSWSKAISSSSNNISLRRRNSFGTSFEIKYLQSLSLNFVSISGETLEHFLANCPVLERLSVRKNKGLVSLKVSGPSLSLKYLEICHCGNLGWLAITNTNIISLKYKGLAFPPKRKNKKKRHFVLGNSPLLVDVFIDAEVASMADILFFLEDCLPQLEILTIEIYEILRIGKDDVKDMEVLGQFKRLKNLKQLVVISESNCDKNKYLTLSYLLNASPSLQKLVLKVWWWDSKMVSRKITRMAGCYYSSSLEEFNFIGYYGRSSDVEFVVHLLENVAALKRIIIDPHDRMYPYESLDPLTLKEEEAATNRARMQLEKIVPPGIELVILDR